MFFDYKFIDFDRSFKGNKKEDRFEVENVIWENKEYISFDELLHQEIETYLNMSREVTIFHFLDVFYAMYSQESLFTILSIFLNNNLGEVKDFQKNKILESWKSVSFHGF